MKTEINSGMKTTEMLTCGIFYCRDSAEINDCGSLQTSSWLDSDMLRNRQQKHTANPLAFSGENAEQTRNSKHNRQNKMSKNN